MKWTANRLMGLLALIVFLSDQSTKVIVLHFLGPTEERIVIPGFFKFVHWENTGAAWSLFHNRNLLLAAVSILALAGLWIWRNHFYVHLVLGRVSLGLVFGGIAGNLFDRLFRGEVIDFLRFYIDRHSGQEIGFPAFNVADSAICIGVGLLILVSWRDEEAEAAKKVAAERAAPAPDAFRADQ